MLPCRQPARLLHVQRHVLHSIKLQPRPPSIAFASASQSTSSVPSSIFILRPQSSHASFSTSARRWKSKPPDLSKGESAEGEKEQSPSSKQEHNDDKEREADTGKDKAAAKAKSSEADAPEPIPPPNSVEARASANSSAGQSVPASPGDTAGAGAAGGSSGGGKKKKQDRSLQKPSVPDVYPQVMAIPTAKRPLFPGFYKAITIRNPDVAKAIAEMTKKNQPYVGAFMFKDENMDKDVIDNIDEVYDVGTFCQVTSAYAVQGDESSYTVILYPHRRIKISSLIPPNKSDGKGPSQAELTPVPKDTAVDGTNSDSASSEIKAPGNTVQDKAQDDSSVEFAEKKGDVVASFEEGGPDSKQSYEPTSFLKKHGVSLVQVDNVTEEAVDKRSLTVRALVSEIVNVFKEIASINPLFRDQISSFSMSAGSGNISDDPGKLADFAAAVSAGEESELQDVLQSTNIEDRLQKALLVIKKELMNAELQTRIVKDVEGKIQKRQREYWLQEQMKGIRRELGIESDGKEKLVENFREKASKLAMPEGVRKVFDEEINKLMHLEQAASEFNVTRNYLDWLTQIPWGQRSAENFEIKNAVRVLDEDHYGLQDVKDRILEFIAVGKLRGTVEGKILCLVGPPGVGKTSIGKSIARALNRQYYRFSMGGLTDVAEIKGHRRTYVGALPGRIIQALKKCQTENPLILIDEVDKIGRGHNGDPSSALLELLDPEQNNSFLDHYMDVPVDLSKVLFVCTANITDTIPRPLLDRMEIIRLSGYIMDEKMAIADRYLAPAAKELSGLKGADVNLTKQAIQTLISNYCRESGVRNLKQHIEKVYRKSAFKIVQDLGEEVLPEAEALTEEGKSAQKEAKTDKSDVTQTPAEMESKRTETPRVALKVPENVHITIDKANLNDYVGPPKYISDRLYTTTPAGVVMGLAWTSMGGAALYVESILETALSSQSKNSFTRTGNLKNVMQESAHIAWSFAKSVMAKKFPDNAFFEHARIHMHCPEGAVAKDGPSAGITMTSSLLSLALDTPLDPTVAMTGELTVTGKVLRIGGLREKTVAAKRAGTKTVIYPRDNQSDWLELPDNLKKDMTGIPVDWYEDVFDVLFPKLDDKRSNNLWKATLEASANKNNSNNNNNNNKKRTSSSSSSSSSSSYSPSSSTSSPTPSSSSSSLLPPPLETAFNTLRRALGLGTKSNDDSPTPTPAPTTTFESLTAQYNRQRDIAATLEEELRTTRTEREVAQVKMKAAIERLREKSKAAELLPSSSSSSSAAAAASSASGAKSGRRR